MTKVTELITGSERGNRDASYESIWLVSTRSKLIYGSLVCRCTMLVLTLFSTIFLMTSISSAQDRARSTPNAARLASGWWFPTETTAPRLLVRMTDLTQFEASTSLRTFQGQAGSYLGEQSEALIANLPDFGSKFIARVPEQALLPEPISLPPISLSALLQTRYAAWESSLSESRALTNVNGVSVYPLGQFDYAGWHLPITLYISPLGGSDAR